MINKKALELIGVSELDFERSCRRNKKKTYKLKPKVKKAIKIILITLCFAILVAVGIFCGKVFGVIKDAKLGIENFIIKNENSILKDKDGIVIATLTGDENREIISISEM